MKSIGKIPSTLLATVLLLSALAAPAWAVPAKRASRVILVLAPYLTWGDVTEADTPRIWSIAEKGAVGDINARSRTREVGEPPSPLEGALSISAGSWAVPDFTAAAAYSADERYEYGSAGEAYERMTGRSAGDRSIVYLGIPVTARKNLELSSEVSLGILGQTIEDAGGVTAALGNSDVGYATGEQRQVRPAALAAMNASGGVHLGDVSQRLIQEDPDAPFGIRTNLGAFETSLDTLFSKTSQSEKPALIVLDAGDGYRAVKFSPQVTDEVARGLYVKSLHALDAVVGYALDRMGPDDVIVVASQSPQDANGYEGLGPVIIDGGSYKGVLTSSSTHRTGVVTNLDVTATVLELMGLSRPVSVLGNSMSSADDDRPLAEKITYLSNANAAAIAIDSTKATVLSTYIALTVLVLLAATLVLLRNHNFKRSRRMARLVMALKIALIGVLSFPLATFAMFVFVPRPSSGMAAVTALVATLAGIWVVGELLRRFAGTRIAIASLSLGIMLLLLVDQWMGAPLSFSTYLGYSPLLAARFYGIGNEGAAILFGASLIGFSAILDEVRGSKASPYLVNLVFPILALVCTVTMAAPMWGANVGVAAWGIVGYGLAWMLFAGRKVTWKTAVVAVVAIAALVGLLVALDFAGIVPETHLARSLQSAQEGGLGELWTIVVRKAQTNLRVLTRTNWSFILIAVLGFLGLMRWRPAGDFAATLVENPALGSAITASLVGGLVAYFTEDSGIVIPALIFLYVGVGIVWMMLARLADLRPIEGEEGR